MLDDILQSAKQNLIERFSSPILGSFAVSWCLWNYRFLVVLFSDNTSLKTFSLIDEVIFPTKWIFFRQWFIAPGVTTLAYIFAYPFIAQIVFKFQREQQRKTLEIRRKIDGETPLTKEDKERFEEEWRKTDEQRRVAISNLRTELAEKERDIETLARQLETAQKSLSNMAARPASDPPESVPGAQPAKGPTLSVSQQKIIFAIGRSDGEIDQGSLKDVLDQSSDKPISKVLFDYDLMELQRIHQIETKKTRGSTPIWSLTHQGRKTYIDFETAMEARQPKK